MSELKSFIVLYDGKFIRAYKESEADKVIAKKDKEIKELKEEINELQTELELWRDGSIISEVHQKELDEKRHSDYKRCLAMAEMCRARYDEEDAKVNGCGASWDYTSKEMKYWDRWRKRWLKLAEKFKPNKEAK